ncbi:protein-export chaperone SecB [Brevibacillus borstelensis]|uniref:protein-export chaperone SecB n=1 Tax=Brevibacillus borstelensis TaxID=45462 RepID=UPI003CE5A454
MSQAALQFKDYYVIETQYKTDPFLPKIPDEKIVPSFSYDISPCDEQSDSAYIELGIEIGDSELMHSSYYVYARILGYFSLTGDISDPKERDTYFRINAVAILYPYLRSLISDLTSRGTESPIILPTMNIQKMMLELEEEKQKKQKVENSSKNPSE